MTDEKQPRIRGRERLALVHDLAAGEISHERLGEKYGRATQTISNFSARNSREITEAREQMQGKIAGDMVGLWVAVKQNRVAEYQQYVEDLQELLEDPDLDPTVRSRYVDKVFKALHAVAEEVGELPTRIKYEPTPQMFNVFMHQDENGDTVRGYRFS